MRCGFLNLCGKEWSKTVSDGVAKCHDMKNDTSTMFLALEMGEPGCLEQEKAE